MFVDPIGIYRDYYMLRDSEKMPFLDIRPCSFCLSRHSRGHPHGNDILTASNCQPQLTNISIEPFPSFADLSNLETAQRWAGLLVHQRVDTPNLPVLCRESFPGIC